MQIIGRPNSTLGFLIMIAAFAVLLSILMRPVNPSVSHELMTTFKPILYLGLLVWFVFIAFTIARNLRVL